MIIILVYVNFLCTRYVFSHDQDKENKKGLLQCAAVPVDCQMLFITQTVNLCKERLPGPQCRGRFSVPVRWGYLSGI